MNRIFASRSILSFVAIVVAAGLPACSGADGEISLDTAESKLTAEANDNLFLVKLDDASDDGYALESVVVKVTIEDGDARAIVCLPNDVNGNQKLDKGDSLKCTEGPTNLFDEKTVGKTCTVEVFAKIDAEEELVGETEWKP